MGATPPPPFLPLHLFKQTWQTEEEEGNSKGKEDKSKEHQIVERNEKEKEEEEENVEEKEEEKEEEKGEEKEEEEEEEEELLNAIPSIVSCNGLTLCLTAEAAGAAAGAERLKHA